jgi:uncharacterized membrane protein
VRMIVARSGENSLVAAAIGSDTKGMASLVLYSAAIGFAFLSPWIAYATYAIVAVIWFIPDRRIVRSLAADGL